eukprot:CAMPEP_0175923238 /NCGR_PEP_ID=MMETSP0108-20121206/14468_1 /TAXON_ID=195067 ORGANISM="Goniomonas pacifica, Strain CCMP1869" /NCGR_SAMPLE_ID=MMETSP0108 /ASSEMBLY_ACC=CAM_ASM_000204 /LENGTH=177 /DNA_ID=CAMNT_0017246233 /DNA_START=75 /DNA_END=608 /DNA_ORIENTATION=+
MAISSDASVTVPCLPKHRSGVHVRFLPGCRVKEHDERVTETRSGAGYAVQDGAGVHRGVALPTLNMSNLVPRHHQQRAAGSRLVISQGDVDGHSGAVAMEWDPGPSVRRVLANKYTAGDNAVTSCSLFARRLSAREVSVVLAGELVLAKVGDPSSVQRASVERLSWWSEAPSTVSRP